VGIQEEAKSSKVAGNHSCRNLWMGRSAQSPRRFLQRRRPATNQTEAVRQEGKEEKDAAKESAVVRESWG